MCCRKKGRSGTGSRDQLCATDSDGRWRLWRTLVTAAALGSENKSCLEKDEDGDCVSAQMRTWNCRAHTIRLHGMPHLRLRTVKRGIYKYIHYGCRTGGRLSSLECIQDLARIESDRSRRRASCQSTFFHSGLTTPQPASQSASQPSTCIADPPACPCSWAICTAQHGDNTMSAMVVPSSARIASPSDSTPAEWEENCDEGSRRGAKPTGYWEGR